MSDNVIDPGIWRRYVLFMSIPNETWTDILKLLSRRILVQNISPACKRLKNICNRNVDNIHVIKEAAWFSAKLRRADPEANQQLQHLAGSNCQLDSQFRLTYLLIFEQNRAILRHCIDLFRGCQLSYYPVGLRNVTHFNEFRIWNCSRISLYLPFQPVDAMPLAVHFLDWLHNVNGDGGAAQEEVHCLIIKGNYKLVQEAIDRLIDGCIQNFQQSQNTKDRRRLVISFSAWNDDETTLLDQFVRRHNQATGEVLLLEHADAANPMATVYRLRRCLAEEEHTGNEFYGKTFRRDGPWDEFAVSGDDGPRPRVAI